MERLAIILRAAAALLTVLMLGSCEADTESQTELLILMYHHVDTAGDGNVTVSADTFESHICRLESDGYTAVSFSDVIAYSDGNGTLPEKPVCIVFDDGYESVFSLAFPILKKHSVKAAVCLIGANMGCDTYKDTEVGMIPHLSWEQVHLMHDSGLIEFGSHTYDMHMYAPLETGRVREYAVPLPDESKDAFGAVLTADHNAMCALFNKNLGYTPYVFAYPHGKSDPASEDTLRREGVRVTLTTENGVNILKRGESSPLYLMYRYNMNEYSDIDAIIGAHAKNKED